jgi:hypothetical protein
LLLFQLGQDVVGVSCFVGLLPEGELGHIESLGVGTEHVTLLFLLQIINLTSVLVLGDAVRAHFEQRRIQFTAFMPFSIRFMLEITKIVDVIMSSGKRPEVRSVWGSE